MLLDWGVSYINWMQTWNVLSRNYGRTPPAYLDVPLFPDFCPREYYSSWYHVQGVTIWNVLKKAQNYKLRACMSVFSEDACLHVKYLSFADLFLAAIIRFVWCGISMLDSTEKGLACFSCFPFIFPSKYSFRFLRSSKSLTTRNYL